MKYYTISADGQESGPYDAVSLIRKVKNGSVTASTTLREDLTGGKTIAASQIEELKHLFSGNQQQQNTNSDGNNNYQLKALLQSGWRFFNFNQSSVIITGIFLISVTIIALILSRIPMVGYILSFIGSFIAFACYQYTIMQMSHGRPFVLADIIGRAKLHMAALALAAVVLAVPIVLGMLLLIAPGLLILTIYIFTPLLIIDRGLGFWDAMEKCRQKTMNMGANNFSTLFALVVINFFAGLLLLPLLITLPVTMAAITEIFDKELSDS